MWEDFISQQIKRTNKNLLLLGGGILAVMALILSFTWREAYNFAFGPFPMQPAELTSIENPDLLKRYFVNVRGEETFPTGLQQVDANNHKNVRAVVVGMVVNKRILLVKTPADNHQVQFTGTLVALPPEIQTGAVRAIEKEDPNLKGAFLPYMLDAETPFRDSDSYIAAVFFALLVGSGIYLAGLSIARMLRPEAHPLLSQLQKYGHPRDVRARIDSELRGEGGGENLKSVHITTNWLIHAAPYKTGVMATRDVVWTYPKVTKHYHNGIPTGKTYAAVIRDSKGQSLEISGKKDAVSIILGALEKRMPWVLVGYNQQLDQLWKKEKPKFFLTMEKRRAGMAPAMR
jgi:hypothetical protein